MMRLTPTEEDRLRIFTAAGLARAVLARGLKLGAPEAVALVCDDMHLAARGGGCWEEVVAVGRGAVTPDQVIEGVASIVPEIRLEVLLDEGTRLVVVREPFGPATMGGPGAVEFAAGEVALVPDRPRITVTVTNTSDRPVRVSSHFPMAEANVRLRFDRDRASGFRPDIPAGDSIRWAPGETKDVELVAFGGDARA